MAAVRHAWMYRIVAVVFLFFGAVWLWRFGFTDYQPQQRPYGLAGGLLSSIIAVYLFRLRRFAIGASSVAVGIVGLCAAVFAPNAQGPVILFLAGLAILCVVYAVIAARQVLTP